ncbi:Cyclic pyranopterin monophosphate synthase [Pelotomaculum propionicicum]|uniref:Cyclic pyranopterin monophosphate synthase n=1 Tax=Pelotomaculum propionicicum TaxID=258475 RepID=A0A4Y7RXF6_9FIRM|nr:Cyclic pyranopterin monophosphate synthase [Pelotomaculum propionicicum]
MLIIKKIVEEYRNLRLKVEAGKTLVWEMLFLNELTHLDERGQARMVEVGAKEITRREAIARGEVAMRPGTLDMILEGKTPKGEVFGVARIAGIMAAKKTPEIIPLCHPLALTGIDVQFRPDRELSRVEIEARVRTTGQTGVEMEALTAVSASALAIYDMCKAVDREMVIGAIRLIHKSGGKSGSFDREGEEKWL